MKIKDIFFICIFLINILPAGAGERVVLRLWTHTRVGAERALIESQVSEFNSIQSEITIELERIPEWDYHEYLETAALSGDLPDILDLDGPYLPYYAWQGYLKPIDSYVRPTMKFDFLPSVLSQGTFEEKLYALGAFESGLALYANKEILENAGISLPLSLKQAWSGEEFLQVLETLKRAGVEYPLDMKINYGEGEWYTYGFSPIVQSFGGDLVDRNSYKSAAGFMDSRQSFEAMLYFQQLFIRGYADSKQELDDDFITGKSALSYVGHWMWPEYNRALGDKLVLLPIPRFGGKAVSGQGSWCWGITASCTNPGAAWQFLSFLLSKEQIIRTSNITGAIPSRKSAAASSVLYGHGAPLRIYYDQLQTIAVPRPRTPAYGVITKVFAESVSAIINGADVKNELRRAALTVTELLREFEEE